MLYFSERYPTAATNAGPMSVIFQQPHPICRESPPIIKSPRVFSFPSRRMPLCHEEEHTSLHQVTELVHGRHEYSVDVTLWKRDGTSGMTGEDEGGEPVMSGKDGRWK